MTECPRVILGVPWEETAWNVIESPVHSSSETLSNEAQLGQLPGTSQPWDLQSGHCPRPSSKSCSHKAVLIPAHWTQATGWVQRQCQVKFGWQHFQETLGASSITVKIVLLFSSFTDRSVSFIVYYAKAKSKSSQTTLLLWILTWNLGEGCYFVVVVVCFFFKTFSSSSLRSFVSDDFLPSTWDMVRALWFN